jgi:hypothetical protein
MADKGSGDYYCAEGIFALVGIAFIIYAAVRVIA